MSRRSKRRFESHPSGCAGNKAGKPQSRYTSAAAQTLPLLQARASNPHKSIIFTIAHFTHFQFTHFTSHHFIFLTTIPLCPTLIQSTSNRQQFKFPCEPQTSGVHHCHHPVQKPQPQSFWAPIHAQPTNTYQLITPLNPITRQPE